MEFERKRHNHSHLNVAPLVDVIFLLILFFMVTSHFIYEPMINVSLPESKTAQAEVNRVQTLTITPEGKINLRGNEVSLEKLRVFMETELTEEERKKVKIKADRQVEVGLLVAVIDELRLARVKNFSIVTNPVK